MQVDPQAKRLYIDSLRINLHTLMAKALEHSDLGSRPRWRVVYMNTVVAEFRLATVKGKDGRIAS